MWGYPAALFNYHFIVYGSYLMLLMFIYIQGLKVFDNRVENFASGAWQALGNAWKGGSEFVHKYVLIVARYFD